MQPRELTIHTPYLTFSAVEWGDPGGKPVLALHGWLDNAASFTPLAPHLVGIRLIAVDLAGHGRSQHRPEGFSYDVWHYVEDLMYIVDALGLEAFSLLGHSMGGIVCTMAAGSVLKEQVETLVTIDGLFPWPRKPEEGPVVLREYINERRTPRDQLPVTQYRSKQQAIRARAMSQFKLSRASSALLVERSIRESENGWMWTSDPRLKLGSPVRFTLEQTLAFPQSVCCPAHMIHADHGAINDTINHYRDRLSCFQFHPLAGSHHLHMDGQVEAVATIVNAVQGA